MIRRFFTIPIVVTTALLAAALGCALTGSCGSVSEVQARLLDGLKVVTVARDLDHPWGLTFLPDGKALITEKGGRMRLVALTGQQAPQVIEGLPPVRDEGQGGLLDVALDPDYTNQPWVYWSYSEAGTGPEARLSGTAVARGQIKDGRMAQSTLR